MKNTILCFLSLLLMALTVGCSTVNRPTVGRGAVSKSRNLTRTKEAHLKGLGYKRATRAEILESITPTFEIPQCQVLSADMGRDAFIGSWTCTHTCESRNGFLNWEMLSPIQTSTYHRELAFYEDGTGRFVMTGGGKETNGSGKWEYANGVFTWITTDAAGRMTRFSFEILWHGRDQMVMRIADLPNYERSLTTDAMKSVSCRYDERGLFHTCMMPKDQRVITLVESPLICNRVEHVE